MVKTLTKKMEKLALSFDRAAYRKAYDAIYFRQTVFCPRCNSPKTKHMLKRHMKTRKCIKSINSKEE